MKCWLLGALALAAWTCVLCAHVRGRGSATAARPESHNDEFSERGYPVLAKFISEITGKNFIVDESVRGKVTIISPTKVTPEQAYSIFQSVLQVKGFTTVQAGKVIKIVPARNVRESAALTNSQQPGEDRGDEYVTRMVRLKNIDAASLVSVIQPMISHDGLVAAFPEDNTLIITDDAYNVDRLLRIIGSLDIQGTRRTSRSFRSSLPSPTIWRSQIEKIMNARRRSRAPPRDVSRGPAWA